MGKCNRTTNDVNMAPSEHCVAACVGIGSRQGEIIMDKEHVKGAFEKTKGSVKDTIGSMTGDAKTQAEGKADKMKGEAHKLAGDVKDAMKDAKKEADKH